MPKALKTPVQRYRQRMKREGLVRVEVQCRKEDAALVRLVVGALTDPTRERAVRYLLEEGVVKQSARGFKDFLMSGGPSFEGLDLDRSRDTGREVDL